MLSNYRYSRAFAEARKFWRGAACLFLAALVVSLSALAQGGAALSGVVKDARQAVVPGASVTLVSVRTPTLSRTTVTDKDGAYAFTGLPDGGYTLTIKAPGFKTEKIELVRTLASRSATQNVALEVGSALESVTVHADEYGFQAEHPPVFSAQATPASSELATTTFTRGDIVALNPANVFELASMAPGVKTEFQGRKGFNFLEMRGGDNVGVVIDGYFIPWTQSSRVLALLPPSAIESARIVRDSTTLSLGPTVALAVSGAMGGTPGAANQGILFINTRRGHHLEGGATIDFANLGSYQFELYHGNRIGRWSYWASGYGKVYDGPQGWNSAIDSGAVLLSGHYDGARIQGDVMAYYDSAYREIQRSANSSFSAYTQRWSYDPMHALNVAATLTAPWNARQISAFSYAHGQVTDHLQQNYYDSTAPAMIPEQDYSDTFHLWHTMLLRRDTLKAGFQTLLWKNPSAGGEFNWNTSRSENLFGGYLQDEHRFNARWTGDGAFRIDRKYIGSGYDGDPTQNTSKTGVTRVHDLWTSPSYGLSLGAAYRANAMFRLTARLGYNRVDADPFLPNYYHKSFGAEERYKLEAGVEAKIHPSFQPTLNFFSYDIHNMKIIDPLNNSGMNVKQVPYYVQVNDVRTGFEFSSKGVLPYGFFYNGNLSYVRSNRQIDDVGLPHSIVAFQLQRKLRQFEASSSIKYVDTYWNNQFVGSGAYLPIGGFTTWNVNLACPFKFGVIPMRATGYARNLLNDQYMTLPAYQDAGRVYGGRIEMFFSKH